MKKKKIIGQSKALYSPALFIILYLREEVTKYVYVWYIEHDFSL